MQIILAVDEDRVRLDRWKEMLSSEYEVILASSGRLAIRMLREIVPDMLFVDLDMKQMDGMDFLKQVQENMEWEHIPMVIVSSFRSNEREMECLKKGAAEYIRIPCEESLILTRIQHSMRMQMIRQKLEFDFLKKAVEVEEKKAEVELQKSKAESASNDALTGLLTRQSAMEKVNYALHHYGKGVFFMLDMDNFKAVNDTYGHMEGDRLLIRFAKALKREAGEDAVVARIGGDEFFVFWAATFGKGEIKENAARIVRKIEREIVSPGKLVRVTVSMGIAVAPIDGTTFEELYGNADKALYYVKNDGKNNYRFFSEARKVHANKASFTRTTLSDIRSSMKESTIMNGSYMVDYNSFEKIYRFIERNVKREQRMVQCVLFTLTDSDKSVMNLERTRQEMEHLEKAIVDSLRRGDVTTCYSQTQMLVLLLDVDEVNAITVIDRIMKKYHNLAENENMILTYEIQPVTGEIAECTAKEA